MCAVLQHLEPQANSLPTKIRPMHVLLICGGREPATNPALPAGKMSANSTFVQGQGY